MNKPNPSLIRQCMVEYANQLGRPYFEVCVVKRVVNAFATGVDDIFKPVIEQMLNDKNKRNASNRRRELLSEFCEDRSYMKLAVQKKAHFELARWADIYADLNKVMR